MIAEGLEKKRAAQAREEYLQKKAMGELFDLHTDLGEDPYRNLEFKTDINASMLCHFEKTESNKQSGVFSGSLHKQCLQIA